MAHFWERAGLPSLAVVGLVSAVTAKRPNSNAWRIDEEAKHSQTNDSDTGASYGGALDE